MLTDYQPAPRLPTSGEQLPLPSLPSPAATTPGLEAEQTAIAPEPKVTGSSDGYGLLDPSEPPLTVSGRSADWEALEKSFGVDQLLADLLASPRSPVPPAAPISVEGRLPSLTRVEGADNVVKGDKEKGWKFEHPAVEPVGQEIAPAPSQVTVTNTNTAIGQQIIAEKLTIVVQYAQGLDSDLLDPSIRDRLRTHAEKAARAVVQEQPDYSASRRHVDGALRIAEACARAIWDRFNQVSATLGEEQRRPEVERDLSGIARHANLAAKLLVAGAALAVIVADLTTTGGMITLASLSYGAGRTLALQQRTVVCTCGRTISVA